MRFDFNWQSVELFNNNLLKKAKMRIYQDVFTDEEFISDSYKMEKLFNDVIGEVKSRMVVSKEAEVDIGCGNAFGGSNE